MEQTQHERLEPTSARYQALVAEIVPKLRRLGPQLSEHTLLETAERLATHRLASEQLGPRSLAENGDTAAYPSFAVPDGDGPVSPLDDAHVRELAVSLTHRMRPVSLHLSEGELVSLATRMAVLESSSPSSHTSANGGSVVTLTNATSARSASGAGSSGPGGTDNPSGGGQYDATTVTVMAELYARAGAALSTYPWLGLFAGASLGYTCSAIATSLLELGIDNAVATSVMFVLFGATIGLLLGRAKGNIESHRLREEARATLAAADRKRMGQGEQP